MLQIQKDASDTVKDERRELSKEMTRRIGQLERQIAEMMEDIQCKQHIIDHYRRGGRVADEPE
jgi:chemotaxis regulatin CheY-phosphate phosphatase CheZ